MRHRSTRGVGPAVGAALLLVVLVGCGQSEPDRPNTIAAPATNPVADTALQRAAEAEAQGARDNAAANLPGENTTDRSAGAADLTTLDADERREDPPATNGRGSSPAPLLRPGSRASFRELEHQLGGSSAVAISSSADRPAVLIGGLRSGPAWSTIKVAISLATERAASGHPDRAKQDLLFRALTASDNAAAEQLWSQLGAHAAERTQAELRAAGDATTEVQAQRVRAEFSPYGQTEWSTSAQADFIAALPCLPHSKPILALMGQVQADQRWGLGATGALARFKGGWGPDQAGRYLVRQMGLISIDDKPVAVAIATKPADGQFATATTAMSRLAQWAATHIDPAALSTTTC